MTLTPFSAFIFDFNGVLFWDEAQQEDSWRAFATQLRPAPLTAEEFRVHVHGRNGKYTLEYLLGHAISQAQADDYMEQKEIIYREMCLALGQGFCLSPGAITLLNQLAAANIPHTIATASGKNNVDFFIEHLELARWFDLAQISYDNGQIAGKPAPDLYLQAAKNLGARPQKCVVAEDSVSGMQAAHNAAIGHIIAVGPKSSHPALNQVKIIQQVVENLGQIDLKTLF